MNDYAALPMTIRKLLFALVAGAFAVSACDFFNRTSAQVQARKVIAATVAHLPAIEVRQEAIAGLDASFPFFDGGFTFDGGFPFDAGIFNFDGGGSITLPPQTVVFAFFGTRNGEGLEQSAPTPIEGATMTIQLKGGAELALKDQGGGTFSLTSAEEKSLVYKDNGDFVFTAKADGQAFVGLVESVPAPERIAAFRPNGSSFIDQAANTDFTFARPDPPNGQERHLAFVAVVPINRDGSRGTLTYSNEPKTPLGLLKLAIAPSEWKRTTVTVPGMAFPEKDRNYLIIMQSAKLGRPDSDNLFLGSALIAGTADVGIVKTR